jgi:hypothetical protein
VARLLDLYEVVGGPREQLLGLAEDATHKGWWEAYSDVLTEGHMAFIGREAEATSILEWQINVVPGPLQTQCRLPFKPQGHHRPRWALRPRGPRRSSGPRGGMNIIECS